MLVQRELTLLTFLQFAITAERLAINTISKKKKREKQEIPDSLNL